MMNDVRKENQRQANTVFITSDISLLYTYISIVMEWVWLLELMEKKSHAEVLMEKPEGKGTLGKRKCR
jgi:hypothetical protein